MKILLAEDENVCQASVVNLCKKFGYEVDVANNGKEAVDLAKKQVYDLVLMDNYMPELSGLQATEAIRALDTGSQFNIVLLSGTDDEWSKEELDKAGFNAFARKPMKKSVFEEITNRFKK